MLTVLPTTGWRVRPPSLRLPRLGLSGRWIAPAAAVALALGLIGAGPARAQPYPSAPVKIIVPWTPGGANDLIARALADQMAARLGQPVIVENRPGANGITGSWVVAKSPPDGYTMLVTSSAHTLNAGLYKKLPFDPLSDFAPASLIGITFGSVLVVRQDSPLKTLADYVAFARTSPGKLSYATNGVGNVTHIAGELLNKAAGIDVVAVPYKGTAPFVTDILGGHIQAGFMSPVAAVPLVKGGQMRALAITGTQRTPSLPDVPTFIEAGYPAVQQASFYGAWFPAGTPRERVALIQQEIAAAMKTDLLTQLAEQSDMIPRASTPEEFSAFLAGDLAAVQARIKWIGLPPIE